MIVIHLIKGFKASDVVYREGLEWIKGRIVNDINNLYCAQDVRTGTIMAVCQVSYHVTVYERKFVQNLFDDLMDGVCMCT